MQRQWLLYVTVFTVIAISITYVVINHMQNRNRSAMVIHRQAVNLTVKNTFEDLSGRTAQLTKMQVLENDEKVKRTFQELYLMYFLQLKCKNLTCGSDIALIYANIFFSRKLS
jgi:hypothetical protein